MRITPFGQEYLEELRNAEKSDSGKTTLDTTKKRFENNRIYVVIALVIASVIVLGKFTEALTKIREFIGSLF